MDTQYKVIEQVSKAALESAVEKYTSRGWTLQGGVSASVHKRNDGSEEVGYLQALILDPKNF